MRIQLILILIITALILTACGKKGPVRPVTKTAMEQPAALPQESSKEQDQKSN